MSRFWAKILKKFPSKRSIHKISAHSDLAYQLLQILIPPTFDTLVCQKGDLHFIYFFS